MRKGRNSLAAFSAPVTLDFDNKLVQIGGCKGRAAELLRGAVAARGHLYLPVEAMDANLKNAGGSARAGMPDTLIDAGWVQPKRVEGTGC